MLVKKENTSIVGERRSSFIIAKIYEVHDVIEECAPSLPRELPAAYSAAYANSDTRDSLLCTIGIMQKRRKRKKEKKRREGERETQVESEKEPVPVFRRKTERNGNKHSRLRDTSCSSGT